MCESILKSFLKMKSVLLILLALLCRRAYLGIFNSKSRQGRLYFTQEYCCFHSPIANTKVIIHVSEILQVNPRNTLVFPTALDVDTKDGKSFAFKSFLFRGKR
jgi:hypothetical protein